MHHWIRRLRLVLESVRNILSNGLDMIDQVVLKSSACYRKDMNLTSSWSLMSPYSSSYKIAARVQFRNNIMSWNFKGGVFWTEHSCSHCLILYIFCHKIWKFLTNFWNVEGRKFLSLLPKLTNHRKFLQEWFLLDSSHVYLHLVSLVHEILTGM